MPKYAVDVDYTSQAGELRGKLAKRRDEIVTRTLRNIHTKARQNVRKRTHSLEYSIYMNYGDNFSTYASSVREAQSANPKVVILPEAIPEWVDSGAVGFAALHGIFNEWGSVNMAAHPFLGPAVQDELPAFESALENILG